MLENPKPPLKPKLPNVELLQPLKLWVPENDGEIEKRLLNAVSFTKQDARGLVLSNSILNRVTIMDSKWLQMHVTDCRLEDCDLSNSDMTASKLTRCEVATSKLTGLKLNEAQLEDVRIIECKANYAQFQQVTCKRVIFEHCNLQDAYFNEADIRGITFSHCDLTRADLTKAKLTGVNFRGSIIEGIRLDPHALLNVKVDLAQAVYVAQMLGLDIL